MDYLVVGWLGIIAFCVLMYVVLDGFTLGTGIILPFIRSPQERNLLYSAILPTWDGNQTWLVLAGASLYGAFPLAFSILLPALYFPIFIMIGALLLRGVVFEFRLKAKGAAIAQWDRLFILGSIVVTFMQGMIVGTLVIGFTSSIEPQVIPHSNWFTPFSVFTGVSLIFGYALLGATRMIIKTENALQHQLYLIARCALFFVWVTLIIISLWTPFVDQYTRIKWFHSGNLALLALLPVITTLAFIYCLFGLISKKELLPYWSAIVVFCCTYLGFGYSIWPYMVPHTVTIWQAAANQSSLSFVMVGACIMLPVLLIYTGYAYYIFRGKVNDVIQY